MTTDKFTVKDFITKKDLPMFSSGARFTLGSVLFLENKHNITATFDLFVRELPSKRNYLVFAGLEACFKFFIKL